jgi:hypothetical protein
VPDAPRPIVSVVIPTYERRDFVRRAVASVLAQTFVDFELIVVDDGSTDGTRAALGNLDRRIRYEWRENGGVSSARNVGIGLARAEIVAFLDSDDHWLPEHLAVLIEVLSRHPEAVLCSTSPRFHAGGRQAPDEAEVGDALPLLLVENLVGAPSGVAVRREALLAVGGFDERLVVMEGWELWLRLAALGPFALLQRRTFVFQATRGSLTERSSRSGEYQRALGIVASSAATMAADSARPDSSDLVERAAGLGAYFDAQRALFRGDDSAARAALSDACARLPELSLEPQLVVNRLSLVRFGREGRLRSYSAAARLWPDARADTALYLRFHALVLAVRLARGSDVVELVRGWPLSATPGFLARNTSVFARLVQRRIQKRRYRGHDATAPRDSPPPSPSGTDGDAQMGRDR